MTRTNQCTKGVLKKQTLPEVRRALEQEDQVKVAVSTTGAPILYHLQHPQSAEAEAEAASAPARSRRGGTPPRSRITKRVLSGGQTELSSVRVRKTAPKKGVKDALGAGECDQPGIRADHLHAGEHRTRVGGGEHRSQTSSPVFQSEYSGNKYTTKAHTETKTRSTSEKASTSV